MDINRVRTLIKQGIVNFFIKNDFTEFDYLSSEPFVLPEKNIQIPRVSFSTLDGKSDDLWLFSSPELEIKKTVLNGILGGTGDLKPFTFAHAFRDCDLNDSTHSREFIMLEWMRGCESFKEVLADFISIVDVAYKIALSFGFRPTFRLNDLKKTYTCNDLFFECFGVNLHRVAKDLKTFLSFADSLKIKTDQNDDLESIYLRIFVQFIEPKLAGKTFVLTEFPHFQKAFAVTNSKNNFYVDRAEVYINGVEIANAYSEVCDDTELLVRFNENNSHRIKNGLSAFDIPKDFLKLAKMAKNKLGTKKYFAGGIGVGFDRLISQLLGCNFLDLLQG